MSTAWALADRLPFAFFAQYTSPALFWSPPQSSSDATMLCVPGHPNIRNAKAFPFEQLTCVRSISYILIRIDRQDQVVPL